MYETHPSVELNRHFRSRPYQGANPEQSRFLFVGLDANYARDLESSPSFVDVLQYHADGVAFWRRHGVHHPFLLSSYRGDGRRYHHNFSRIGFTSADAAHVSFVELLHIPTVGRSSLAESDLDPQHLRWLSSLVTAEAERHVFLSAGVVRLMLATQWFPWLSKSKQRVEVLPSLYVGGRTTVHLHLHFSNYGKFQAQLEREANAIAMLAGKRDG